LTLGNYRYLLTDEVYGVAYLYSLRTAFFSTLICLLLGYPMAYAIARSPRSTQGLLLLIIMLPFWTSFLLRVYALEESSATTASSTRAPAPGPHQSSAAHHAHESRRISRHHLFLLAFMVLPLFATLEKLDPTLLEAAADLGSTPRRAFLDITLPLSLPGSSPARCWCSSRRSGVRDPVAPRRPEPTHDWPRAVG